MLLVQSMPTFVPNKIQDKMKKLIFIICLFVAFSMQSCVAVVHPIGEGGGRGEHHEHHDEGHHGGDEHHDRH